MQLRPSPELADLIKHYLVIDNQSEEVYSHRFFPDGHAGFVFSYGDPLIRSGANNHPAVHLNSFLYGQANRYHNLIAGKKLSLFIVVLQPWGLYSFSGIPGIDLTNLQVSLSDVFGQAGSILQDQVLACPDTSGRIKQVEAFLLKHRRDFTHESALIQTAIQLIHQTNGSITVQQLMQQLAITERSLERRFDKVIGVGPKQFARILRLQNCLKTHRTNPALNLTELAYVSGYYDQAHFIKEFTHFVGITPKQYDATTKRLAVNLMPIAP